MWGPKERERCDKHPARWVIYCWTWPVPQDDETHLDCLQACGEPETIRSCATCDDEARDPWDYY